MIASPAVLLREAWAIAVRDRPLLIALAGVFVLLPQLAVLLWVPQPPPLSSDIELAALLEGLRAWWSANAVPLIAAMALGLVGQAAIAALLLDARRPTVGETIGIGFATLPWLFMASALGNLIVVGGLFAFVIPGLYIAGRAFPLAVVMTVEKWRNPVAGLVRTLRLTRGHGFVLLAVQMALWLLAAFPASIFARIGVAGADSPVIVFIGALGQAVIASAAAVASLLMQATLYRRLAAR